MPIRKTVSHTALMKRLLTSEKLSKSEQTAFKKIAEKGKELDRNQKLWIETLNEKYLAK